MGVETPPTLSIAATPPTGRPTLGSSCERRTETADGRFAARLHPSLDAVAPLWRTLETQGAATAYQRFDWAKGVVDHLAGPTRASPQVVEVTEVESGRPVMLVPLAFVRRRGHTVLTWLDLGVCDYAAPLLAPGIDLAPGDMAAVWRAIRSVAPRADLVRISRIPAEIGGRPNPLAALPGLRRMEMQASGVAIEGPSATLLDRLCRPGARKDMAKTRRRLERQGEVAFVKAATSHDVATIFDELVAQRRSRFAEIGRFDLLSRPEVEAFYRAAAEQGLSGGPARLFGLSVGREWVAAALGLVHGGTFHGVLLTMAGGPWRNASPGLHIVAEAMRWARDQGLGYFDFTVGVMPYKEDFGVQTRDLQELVEAATLRGVAVREASRGVAAAKTWLRDHPVWYARLQNARRWLRRKAI